MSTLHVNKRKGQRQVHMLIGVIASGKSGWVEKYLSQNPNTVVVSDDALFLAMHNGNYKRWDDGLKLLYKTTEDHVLTTALALGVDVIVDRPHLRVDTRRRVLGIAQSLDVSVSGHIFPHHSAIVHAERRFRGDTRGQTWEYWREVAQLQINQYEPPSLDEGFEHLTEEN